MVLCAYRLESLTALVTLLVVIFLDLVFLNLFSYLIEVVRCFFHGFYLYDDGSCVVLPAKGTSLISFSQLSPSKKHS